MNRTVRLRRLNLLLDTLKNIPQKRFDMENWAAKKDGLPECKENLSCGAAACALGWLASTKQARKAGLKLVFESHSLFGMYVVPTYKGEEDYDAGALYLGITYDESEYLFNPDHYNCIDDKPISKHQVIKRVKELIKKYEKNNQVWWNKRNLILGLVIPKDFGTISITISYKDGRTMAVYGACNSLQSYKLDEEEKEDVLEILKEMIEEHKDVFNDRNQLRRKFIWSKRFCNWI